MLSTMSLIGFKAYMELSPEGLLSSNITFIYAIINLGLLLMGVVVISLVSSIYSWYYNKHKLLKI
jgi:hypothetical protein